MDGNRRGLIGPREPDAAYRNRLAGRWSRRHRVSLPAVRVGRFGEPLEHFDLVGVVSQSLRLSSALGGKPAASRVWNPDLDRAQSCSAQPGSVFLNSFCDVVGHSSPVLHVTFWLDSAQGLSVERPQTDRGFRHRGATAYRLQRDRKATTPPTA